jgi:hypothetical protein
VSRQSREVIADWLIVLGAVVLFASLFLTWSHQFSRPFLAEFGASELLRGTPRDPTAWQVYSSADVVLALTAGALFAVSLVGNRPARIGGTLAAAAALAFTLHALSAPPTNHATVFDPALSVPNYFPNSATPGIGETIAIVGLGLALSGLALSFTAD